MSSNLYIKEPAFYSRFQCIGDKCPNDCCHGWQIIWSEKEVERLKAAECSEELRNILDNSFEKAEGKEGSYQIKLNNNGYCPFIEKGLCKIQKELGAGYFSSTCANYPRHMTVANNYVIRTFNTSCYAAMDFLCNDESCMEILTKPQKPINLPGTKFSKEDMLNCPALIHFGDIKEFFLNILSDKTRSLETSTVLGAVAAKLIDKHIAAGKADKIPELLKNIAPQMKDPAQTATLENVKPNYGVKLGFGLGFIALVFERKLITVVENDEKKSQLIIGNFISNLLDADGKISEEKFIEGERKFLKAFEGRDHAMRNIALNIFIESDMPFKNQKYSVYENYCCFVAQMAAVKIIAAAAGYEKDTAENIEQAFKNTVSIAARTMCHNAEYIDMVTELMKTFNCTSPAHLAYILK